MNDTMNETNQGATQPPPYPPAVEPRPPLRRSHDDRIVAGVAGGLGRTFGVDPVVFRVVLVALTVIGGSGIILYGLLWLLVPEDGSEGSSVADRWVRSRRWTTATVVLLAFAAAVVLSLVVGLDPGPLVLLAVLGALALVLGRRDRHPPRPKAAPVVYGPYAGPTYGPQPYVTQPYAAQPYAAQPYATQPYAAQPFATQPYSAQPPAPPYLPPPRPPKPPRERSALGVLTLGLAAVTAGVMVAVRMVDGDRPSTLTILAATTLAIGLGLLVGTFVGRARWLVIPAVALLLATAVTSAYDSFDGPSRNQTFAPQTLAEVQPAYDWRSGALVLDLTDVAGAPDLTTSVRLGAGSLRVIVPAGAVVLGQAHVGVGSVRVTGAREQSGFSTSVTFDGKAGTASHPAGTRVQTITLDLEVGIGEVVVSHA